MMAVANRAFARKRFIAWAAMAIVTMSLAACGGGAPVTPGQSKKEEGYSEKLQTVLVVRNLFYGGMSEVNVNGLIKLDEIKTAFEEKIAGPYAVRTAYVDVTEYRKSPTDIDREKAMVAEATAAFRPAQILELKTSGLEISANLRRYTIDATVFDTGAKKVVWRGQFVVNNLAGRIVRLGDRFTSSHQEEANLFVDALSSQLKKAGLL
jgi:hypothetical protein